jgi:ribonuclease E
VQKNQRVEDRLRDAVKQDRARIQIGRFAFGLLAFASACAHRSASRRTSSAHVAPDEVIRSVESLALAIHA